MRRRLSFVAASCAAWLVVGGVGLPAAAREATSGHGDVLARVPALASVDKGDATLSPPPMPARELHLLDTPAEDSPFAEPRRASQARRILAELGMGTLSSVALGVALSTAGFISVASGLESHMGRTVARNLLVGMTIGFPAGVWMGGELNDGEGWKWATMAGALPGLLVALAPEALLGGMNRNELLGYSMLLVVPWASIAIYELTDAHEQSKRAASRVRLQPVVGMSRDSARVGLQGSF